MSNTSTDLAISGKQGIVPMLEFSDEDVRLIKKQIAPNATDGELDLLYTAKARGLNPLTRQLYFIKYKEGEAPAFVTSIDALRLIAHRCGDYLPGPPATFEYNKDGLVLSATAYCKKFVKGEWHMLSETAYWDEQCQYYKDRVTGKSTPKGKWATMERTMIAKCAEGKLLRRGWPEDLSGLYEEAEIRSDEDAGGNDRPPGAAPLPPSGRKTRERAATAPETASMPLATATKRGKAVVAETPESKPEVSQEAAVEAEVVADAPNPEWEAANALFEKLRAEGDTFGIKTNAAVPRMTVEQIREWCVKLKEKIEAIKAPQATTAAASDAPPLAEPELQPGFYDNADQAFAQEAAVDVSKLPAHIKDVLAELIAKGLPAEKAIGNQRFLDAAVNAFLLSKDRDYQCESLEQLEPDDADLFCAAIRRGVITAEMF